MAQLKVTAKGQITVKKDLLAHMGVKPGDTIEVKTYGVNAVTLRPVEKTKTWQDLANFLPPTGLHFTLEEIEEAIQKGWAGELDDRND